jgi:Xaa-Pro aminopeptidase
MFQTFDERGGPALGRAHLPLLRDALARLKLDGFIVPHEDEYQNEYLPPAYDRLAWLTGFTGSAGIAIVLTSEAAVFTDGRYALQLRDQVDGALFAYHDSGEGRPSAYLRANARPGMRIGYDSKLHSPDALDKLKSAVRAAGAELVPVSPNPIDGVWDDRPPIPAAPVVPHALDYAGESSASKRKRLGDQLGHDGADAALLTSPASLAWLFNIRGGDVKATPVPLGAAILTADAAATLFLAPAAISAELRSWLGDQVALKTLDELQLALDELAGKRVRIDPENASAYYFERLESAGARIMRAVDPVVTPRACKNEVELEGARRAHIRDGVALTRFLHWLAQRAARVNVSEIEACKQLEAFRAESGVLKDLSFDSITGAGPHGAIVHYRVTTASDRVLERNSLFLIDSGAQYLDGTTDVTRTVAVGEPSAEMRDRFTRVLKGHIALARVRFPAGTTGHQLDTLARAALWSAGLDYDHGTGHGVGSYLGVHEGPQRIAKAPNSVALQPGMIVSNEPGYYKAGAYGIRIENLQVVTPPAAIAGGDRPMLGFETLTLAPIDRQLVAGELLVADERAWLDAYHARVLLVVGAQVAEDVRAWLAEVCAPLG